MAHPEEIWPLMQLYQRAAAAKKLPKDETWRYCYGALNRTSRSFALVIQQLPPELKDAVCVFYLVLRALDTVEDDMSVPVAEKVPVLRAFHERCGDRGFKMECGMKESEKDLMANYAHVADAFLQLDAGMQRVISEITRRMGNGMADFIEVQSVDTVADWDKYCFYVAGLVGIGLSQLFAESELESGEFSDMEELANQMGLFLQKTNIIRDYLEDITEEPAPRVFWPKEIWGQYGQRLEDFKERENLDAALQCLNHMITNALGHVEACFEYMIKLRNPAIFNFCAIPQMMAMGTLSLCYNNPEVFQGVVKMRRGQTASLVVGMNGMESMYNAYAEFASDINAKCQGVGAAKKNEQVTAATLKEVGKIQEICNKGLARYRKSLTPSQLGVQPPIEMPVRFGVLFLFGGYFAYAWQLGSIRESLGVAASGDWRVDIMQKVIATLTMIFALYIFITGKRV